MTIFQPATPHSNSIVRPQCGACGNKMLLALLTPDAPGYERRTFQCPICNYSKTEIVEF